MRNANKAQTKKKSTTTTTTSTAATARSTVNGAEVEVLYQRMGSKWYAFSLIENEVFVGSLTPEQIHGEDNADSAIEQKTFGISGKA